ncbi:hypothetical protein [Variovorax guangxiensis]|uniref:hypothetical protein n=1 Tax=Variovorax guangxiensis TaxID=1775474 RepID=UPI00285EFF31|nr:alpha/beta superfamily hydrolase [Variovorax guangxiensis]
MDTAAHSLELLQSGPRLRVPLASVFEWTRPQAQPVVVVPGADHFFTGRLHILRALVLSHFAG